MLFSMYSTNKKAIDLAMFSTSLFIKSIFKIFRTQAGNIKSNIATKHEPKIIKTTVFL